MKIIFKNVRDLAKIRAKYYPHLYLDTSERDDHPSRFRRHFNHRSLTENGWWWDLPQLEESTLGYTETIMKSTSSSTSSNNNLKNK